MGVFIRNSHIFIVLENTQETIFSHHFPIYTGENNGHEKDKNDDDDNNDHN